MEEYTKSEYANKVSCEKSVSITIKSEIVLVFATPWWDLLEAMGIVPTELVWWDIYKF